MDLLIIVLAIVYMAIGTFVTAVLGERNGGGLFFLWLFWPVAVLAMAIIMVVLTLPYKLGEWVRDKFL